MSDKVWAKLSHYIGLLPIGALFGLVAFVANVEIKDLDLWLHMGVGRFILENHFVPRVDVLSCSIAGVPWINHEWLFQVVVYSIFSQWGAVGLLKMQIIIVCVTMGILLLLGYSKDKQLFITFMLFMVFLVFQQRFTVRPDIFSLFFFAIYIFILALHIDKKWALPALFIIQVLWTNFHGFFFLGPLFVLIGIFSEWVKRRVPLPAQWNEIGRLTDDEYKRLKIILVFVILACLVNPYFVKGAWYPLGVLFSLSGENKIFFSVIQELQKPVKWESLFDLSYFIYYKLLIILSAVTFIFNRRRIDISALIFWLVFLVFSLQAVRNAIFFAFAAYLVVMTNILTINTGELIPIRFTAKRFEHITAIVFKILLLGFLFQFSSDISSQSYYDFDKYEHKSEFGGISQRTYPDKAVDFLVGNKIKGNFFNDFNSGAYLVGRTHPDIKVFIDGRTEVYGGEFFNEYRKIWEDGDGELFEKKAEEFNITGVLMNSSRQKLPEAFLRYLYDHPDWVVVYFNYDGVIFLKNVKEYAPVIKQHAIDLPRWQAPELDLVKVGPAKLVPYQYFFRASTLYSLELFDPAMSELMAAVEIMPGYAAPYHKIGQIYLKRNQPEEAFKNLRVAAVLFPDNRQVRLDFAYAYTELKAYDGALEQAKAFVRRWPNDQNGHYLLAELYIATDDFESVEITIDQVMAINPTSSKDLITLGELAQDKQAFDTAEMIYTAALKTNDNLAQIHTHLGELFKQLGDDTQAQYHFHQAKDFTGQNAAFQPAP